jgi:hypothetical protein
VLLRPARVAINSRSISVSKITTLYIYYSNEERTLVLFYIKDSSLESINILLIS